MEGHSGCSDLLGEKMEQFNYFNVGVIVSFIFEQEMSRSFNFPVNVVLELKEAECFDLENMKNAKNKALLQLEQIFGKTKMESYIEQADFVIPSVFSISFLGSNTHEGFLGEEPTSSLAESQES